MTPCIAAASPDTDETAVLSANGWSDLIRSISTPSANSRRPCRRFSTAHLSNLVESS